MPSAQKFTARRRVSRKEAAKILGVAPGSLAKWAVQGIGPPFFKFRRKVSYEVETLEKFALAHQVGG